MRLTREFAFHNTTPPITHNRAINHKTIFTHRRLFPFWGSLVEAGGVDREKDDPDDIELEVIEICEEKEKRPLAPKNRLFVRALKLRRHTKIHSLMKTYFFVRDKETPSGAFP